ncbi:MAG: alanine--glyoxylate aminotransferase family protein, partial [Candidatus Tectomicrobia bacterium]|nr:alanine--glyoxylate aminotransferase family protein [Candidatus Tectomicrobia bacterium]
GLQAVLKQIKQEGLEAVFARHDLLARATRAGMLALGLNLYTQDLPSNAVTAVKVPEGVDGQALTKQLREKYGLTIAGGQDRAKGKIFRIAHLGYADVFDVIIAVSAVEMCLNDLGFKAELGRGVRAAQEILSLA